VCPKEQTGERNENSWLRHTAATPNDRPLRPTNTLMLMHAEPPTERQVINQTLQPQVVFLWCLRPNNSSIPRNLAFANAHSVRFALQSLQQPPSKYVARNKNC
jgi:hypothetical protein